MYHIEVDVNNKTRLLYSDLNSVKVTDGNVSSLLAGAATYYGYKESDGEEARFYWITAFTQVNRSHVAAVDAGNNCLRWINRLTRATSPLVGQCGTSGNSDRLDPLFSFP